MSAVASWARLDLRRRWRSFVVLTLLVAVGVGTVMATLAGAHRGATALDRLLEVSKPATANVTPNTPDFDWAAIAALPYVEAIDPWVLLFEKAIDGVDPLAMDHPVTTDARFRDLEVPIVLEGRLAEPGEPHEVVINQRFADLYDTKVGGTLTLRLIGAEQLGQPQVPKVADFTGPVVTLSVVGIIRSPWVDTVDRYGRVEFTPALLETYRPNMYDAKNDTTPTNALVRLRDGDNDLARLRADIARISGRDDINVVNLEQDHAQYRHQLRMDAAWLLAFSLAVAATTLVMVGQALMRAASTAATDLRRAAALGMTPRQRRCAAIALPAAAIVIGLLLGMGAAVAASRAFPIGLAVDAEPDPGFHVDGPVLLLVGLAFAVLLLALVAWAASSAGRAVAKHPQRPTFSSRLTAFGLPVPLMLGTRMALEPGVDTNSVPTRPAMIASIASVTGIVASLAVISGLADLSKNPERLGQTWQVVALTGLNGFDLVPFDEVRQAVDDLAYVEHASPIRLAVATGSDGRSSISVWSTDGTLPTIVVDGRMPQSPHETALAPVTARELGVDVGDSVTLNGQHRNQAFTVTGIGFVATSIQTHYYSGAWVSDAGFDRLFTGWGLRLVFATFVPGTSEANVTERVIDDLTATRPDLVKRTLGLGGTKEAGFGVEAPLDRVLELRRLPWAFAGFVALLGIAAIGHAVAVAVRRRGGELAVVRAVGMTPRQVRLSVVTQGLALAAIGIVFGVPLGVALGQSTWRLVARVAPLEYVSPGIMAALAVALVTAIVTALLVTVIPARHASRASIADTLRTE